MAAAGFYETNNELAMAFGQKWVNDSEGQNYLAFFYDRGITGDHRAAILDGIQSYMQDNYGLDFIESLDWDAYREWYDSTAA